MVRDVRQAIIGSNNRKFSSYYQFYHVKSSQVAFQFSMSAPGPKFLRDAQLGIIVYLTCEI